MRAAVPWTLFAASFVVNLVFLGGVLMSGGREMVHETAVELPPADVTDPLALTEAQAAGLAALRDRVQERGAALREASGALRQELLGLLAKPAFDRAAFGERLHAASAQREAQFLEIAEMLHGYLQDLSAEQRADLLQRAQDRGFMKALLFGGAAAAAPQKSSN